MHGLLNSLNQEGNTPLYYATGYPSQDVVRKMLKRGANFRRNERGTLNVRPSTVEEFLDDDCIEAFEDNEKITDIRVSFEFFQKKGQESE